MKLRIWLPCILLIVIFIILVRKYFTDTEGFQASTPYTSPPAQSADEVRINFWSILSKYGTSGSTGTGGSGSGSGSGPPSISNLLDQVMNPNPKDTFKMVFPKYVSMYALAKYNYNPVTARNVLINEYDMLQTELQTTVETEQNSRNDFASDPKGKSCEQINTMTMGFYGRLINLYKGAQDLSGVVHNAGSFHDENLSLQNIVLSACKTQGSLPSEDCIKLATVDEKLFPLLPRFDAMNVNILADGGAIQDMINTLVQAYMGMGCTRSTGGSAPPDGTPSIDSIFSETYIDSLGTIDTDFLYEKLQELSPYYVSPNIINYISGKLIGTSEFNAGLSDSLDYLKDMNKVTNNIVSLNTDIAPLGTGKFFSQSGSGAGGFINCPPGYYCPVGSTMPIQCPVGTYCPAGTTDAPIQCDRGTFSPPGSTKVEDCTDAPPVGYYKDNATGKMVECPTGSYCANGIRTICPAGTYNMKKGMGSDTACLNCPKGSYCKTSTSITPCDPGKYNPDSRKNAESDCKSCPVGTTCINKGTVTPMPCAAGTYSNTLGLKIPCTPVIEGYYLSGTGNTVDTTKEKCSAGYYCPGGTGAPLTCPTGSYCYGDGLARATPCPAGSYGSIVGLQSATCTGRCDAGYLCPPGSLSSTAIPCPEGYYCPAGSGTATICPPGTYCPRVSPSPVSCPEGTYNEVAGKREISVCLPCPPGKECVVATVNPTPCPLGYYCPGGGETNACIPGHYCDETGLREPKMCPPGTYKPPFWPLRPPSGIGYLLTDCKPCERGTWSNTPGEINGCRETCPPGSYCPSPNSMSTYTIPSTGLTAYLGPTQGSRTTITVPIGTIEPVPCPIGTYCAQSGTAIPTPCPPGTYSTRTGQRDANTCQPCELGKYCPTAGAGSQVVCPVGTFCPTQGGSSPTQCLIGQICPVPGLQAGSACPPGKLCDITGIGPPPPYKSCPPGTYSTGGAGSSCTRCPVGTFGSGDSTTSACSGQCPAGYYCTDGTTPLGGSNPPIPCPAGQSSVSGGVCTNCPANQSSVSGGVCTNCPAGQSSVSGGVCTNCPAGQSSVSGGSCTPCPDRQVSVSGGLCAHCPHGQYYNTSTKSCVPCEIGSFSNITGATSCTKCPANTYNGATGAIVCTRCPGGTSSTAIGATLLSTCQACPVGRFSVSGSNCQICPAGTYNNTAGRADSCIKCPGGTFSTSTGATASTTCQNCLAGRFSGDGATACSFCPAGTYNNTAGRASCTDCPLGTFSNTEGATVSTTCIECLPGRYSDVLGAKSCKLCPIGTYNDQTGRTSSLSCLTCPMGTYSNSTGATSCSRCLAGSYSASTGATSSTTCLSCPVGTYSTTQGARLISDCLACPAGTFSNTERQQSCTQCPAGTYTAATGRTACTQCPAGTFSPLPGGNSLTTCIQCPTGTYSTSLGARFASTCTKCPVGTYSASTRASSPDTCLQCPENTYSAITGAAYCETCPPNTFSNAIGATSSTTCRTDTSKISLMYRTDIAFT